MIFIVFFSEGENENTSENITGLKIGYKMTIICIFGLFISKTLSFLFFEIFRMDNKYTNLTSIYGQRLFIQ